MQSLDNNTQAFLALVRAGLWETDIRLLQFNNLDYSRVLSLAEEQSVVGLVAAGLEHVIDVKAPKEVTLQFLGQVLQIEQRNTAMNSFIEVLVDKLRKVGIYALLVKGQGVAQAYEKPLWRSCGDVDLFLSEYNYVKAKEYLKPQATYVETEGTYTKHFGMTIGSWVIELHGSIRCGLSCKIDSVLDSIQNEVFYGRNVRSWMNGKTQVFLPSVDDDILVLFTHFLKHFYIGGLGLRQICDWSRMLWKYCGIINCELLEKRLKKMRLMTEWKAFGSFAVDYLGLPPESMPFYSHDNKWHKKSRLIMDFVFMSGNFGQNRDNSYYKQPLLIRKIYSMGRRIGDSIRHSRMFPLDSIRFFPKIMFNGVRAAIKGE